MTLRLTPTRNFQPARMTRLYRLLAMVLVGGAVLSATASCHSAEPSMQVSMIVVPQAQQRYDTVGDWRFDTDGNLHITVSQLSDPRYETLIAVHELVEALLCKAAGITEASVTAFDTAYQGNGEPGDDPKAPYRHQHAAATFFEKKMAKLLGVNWKTYDRVVAAK